MTATIHHGDCIEVMQGMPDNSVDAVVTDPPYGLRFIGIDKDAEYVEIAKARIACAEEQRQQEIF